MTFMWANPKRNFFRHVNQNSKLDYQYQLDDATFLLTLIDIYPQGPTGGFDRVLW